MFMGLSFVLVLSSCTVEKRLHTSGYHIEWNNSKHKVEKNELSDIVDEKQISQKQVAEIERVESVTNLLVNTASPVVSDENHNANVNTASAKTNQKIASPDKVEMTVEALTPPNAVTKSLIEKKVNKIRKKLEKNSEGGESGKSQLIALLLCILVGALGIHRFYLGYTGIGILMLLTGGLCGILLIVDLIRIITGDLKPINGDYSEKL